MNTREMFERFRQEIQTRRDAAYKELSRYDAQEQDLLHYLENEKCDAVDMVRVAKELKMLRQHRRMAKIEVDRCNSIHSSIAKKNLKKV